MLYAVNSSFSVHFHLLDCYAINTTHPPICGLGH